MIIIYSKDLTSRHIYVFRLIFEHWLHEEWRCIHNEEEYSGNGILIRYDESPGRQGLFIKSSGLLSESNIRPFVPENLSASGIPHLFPVKDNACPLPFDVFSAVFWMVSRYEEYLPFEADIHGRFDVAAGYAFKNGFHNKPVIELWIMKLVHAIQKRYPEFKPQIDPYSFLATYDIDQAWAYLHKPAFRCLAAATLNILKRRFAENRERIAVLSGKKPDPFDTYDLQLELQDRYRLKPIYFVHPGTYGKHDKNISLQNKAFRELIRRLNKKAMIGLHASYRSADDKGLLKKEMEDLSEVIAAPVTACRNHFLRISLPWTYRNYISCGITDDYSLGWISDGGFRAGTSKSFPFYDLQEEKETTLMIHPLSIMEGAYITHRKLTVAETQSELKNLIMIVKETKGRFVSLWHNECMGSTASWNKWKEVYINMIEEALPDEEQAGLSERK